MLVDAVGVTETLTPAEASRSGRGPRWLMTLLLAVLAAVAAFALTFDLLARDAPWRGRSPLRGHDQTCPVRSPVLRRVGNQYGRRLVRRIIGNRLAHRFGCASWVH